MLNQSDSTVTAATAMTDHREGQVVSAMHGSRDGGGRTVLTESPARHRWEINRRYLASLSNLNLLRPYLAEAGLWTYTGSRGTTIGSDVDDGPSSWHWGWESVTSELRGHILGHWLAAAARVGQHDPVIAARSQVIVAELGRCQQANGGEWVGPFPSSLLERLRAGRRVWAPHYTLHKIIMGLIEQYHIAGNDQALDIVIRFARWIHRWTDGMSRDQLDEVLDHETGGMLEIWADLYAITGDPQHADLINRYDRPRFFEPLLAGADVLTNKHANTQVAEILGAARAWEVTGDVRWRRIVEAFWRSAVTERGIYCTGGSTAGEIWQPRSQQSARLENVQEHCVVFNLMRLASILLRWTGDPRYADYWERNLLNGIWAQQHPESGMPSYFLPLAASSQKSWGRPVEDFWCCHGTLLQAHTTVEDSVVLCDDAGISIAQYLPSVSSWEDLLGSRIKLSIRTDTDQGLASGERQTAYGAEGIQRLLQRPLPTTRPRSYQYIVDLDCDRPTSFRVRLRVPEWAAAEPLVRIDGEPVVTEVRNGWISLTRTWSTEQIMITLPAQLSTYPLPDDPGTVAVVDGPLVLAGLIDHETELRGDPDTPTSFLTPDQERHHSWWKPGTYRTVGQPVGFRFIPLNEVRDEPYTVYFPITTERSRPS